MKLLESHKEMCGAMAGIKCNLTQHGETHQVDQDYFITIFGPGTVGYVYNSVYVLQPASILLSHTRQVLQLMGVSMGIIPYVDATPAGTGDAKDVV